MKSQRNQVLELLQAQEWVCTSDMYRLFMADPRRRLCDIKDKGWTLEARRCQQHNYHKGGSKEWRIVAPPKLNKYQAYHAKMQSMESIPANLPLNRLDTIY